VSVGVIFGSAVLLLVFFSSIKTCLRTAIKKTRITKTIITVEKLRFCFFPIIGFSGFSGFCEMGKLGLMLLSGTAGVSTGSPSDSSKFLRIASGSKFNS
jgi:hypothetical protein